MTGQLPSLRARVPLTAGPVPARFEAFSSGKTRRGQRGCGRQTPVFDARYHGHVRIEYPLHPLFGEVGRVVRRVRYPLVACVEIQFGESLLSVPDWMTQADSCQQFTCGHDPVPSLDVLLRIIRFLDA